MTNRRIHIVSFDVPFEPNYGGILDVYLRAKALKQAGFYIIMHCFDYGRGKLKLDTNIADEVFYYKRKTSIFSFIGTAPYIVRGRKNKQLLVNLRKDNDPILLEGQHSTGFIHHLNHNDRKIWIRKHNVEWQYYSELANRERSLLRLVFYRTESRRLRHQEARLYEFPLLCISKTDLDYYSSKGAKAYLATTPLFFEEDELAGQTENYALFHGNLSVAENIEALEILVDNISKSETSIPIKVAGKGPSEELLELLKNAKIECFSDPSMEEMKHLIQKAKTHLCLGFQQTGLKLKLLQSLETGKPCVVTKEMLFGTELEKFCIIWDPQQDLSALLSEIEIDPIEIEQRRSELKKIFAPKNYVKVIEKLIEGGMIRK